MSITEFLTPLDFVNEQAAHDFLVARGYEREVRDIDGSLLGYETVPGMPAVDHIGVAYSWTEDPPLWDGTGEPPIRARKERANGRWMVNINEPASEGPTPTESEKKKTRAIMDQEPGIRANMRAVDPDIAAYHNVAGKQVPIVESADASAAMVAEATDVAVRMFM